MLDCEGVVQNWSSLHRLWHKKLTGLMSEEGFYVIECTDPSILIQKDCHSLTLMSVYVDDLLITSVSMENVDHTKQVLNKVFKMTDLGEAKTIIELQDSLRPEQAHFDLESGFVHWRSTTTRRDERLFTCWGAHEAWIFHNPGWTRRHWWGGIERFTVHCWQAHVHCLWDQTRYHLCCWLP